MLRWEVWLKYFELTLLSSWEGLLFWSSCLGLSRVSLVLLCLSEHFSSTFFRGSMIIFQIIEIKSWGAGGGRSFLVCYFRVTLLAACISSGIYFFYRSRVAVMKYWWASGRVIAWKKVLGFDPHLFVLIWFACIDVLFGFSCPVLISSSFFLFLISSFNSLPCCGLRV